MTIQVLSIDHAAPLSVMTDSELAVRTLTHNLPYLIRRISESAEDQQLDVDWTTFKLEVDAKEPPFPGTAAIRVQVRAS